MISRINRTPRVSPVIGWQSCRYGELAVPIQPKGYDPHPSPQFDTQGFYHMMSLVKTSF